MSNSNSPWGRKPSGNRPANTNAKPETNSFEKIIRDAQQKMRDNYGGGSDSPQQTVVAVCCLLFILWLGTGVYRVNSDEVGVVQRFGAYNRTATPGLNYHLPYPIEQVTIPSVTSVNRLEIGGRGSSEKPTVRTAKLAMMGEAPAPATNTEGHMLTSDRNIVDIVFEVQWKIDAAHPEKFLFSMRDAAANIKPVAESAMREVIGRNTLDDVLTGGQSQIAEDTKLLMQQMFDDYGAGIEIIAVNLSRPDVPTPVIDEFQDVKRAEQDKQTAESVAEGYRNEILPRAKGDAAKMIEDAEAYKSRVIADAQGDAARFKQVYAEYALAKDVTRRRIYLETMEAVLKNVPKTVVDSAAKGVVPFLPLSVPARGQTGAAEVQAAPAATPAAR